MEVINTLVLTKEDLREECSAVPVMEANLFQFSYDPSMKTADIILVSDCDSFKVIRNNTRHELTDLVQVSD